VSALRYLARMLEPSLRLPIAVVAVSLAALLPAAPPAAAQAPTVCPATFHVLHDDFVGNLALRAGHYQVTVSGGLTCARSSRLFARFLQDYDGVLPGRWRVVVSTSSFVRGRGPVGFGVQRLRRQSGGGGGRHPAVGSRRCPGTFRVLHDDRIGRLMLPAGPYRITLLSRRGLSCRGASRRFTQFLDNDYAGVLPRPWRLNVQNALFRRGNSQVGFRVKPARPR
jgi:hypothetical protein